jgi:hypothetical protein
MTLADKELISKLGNLGIKDDDKSLDGDKTFTDIKAGVAKAIGIIDEALPKMKAAGIDMQKASSDVDGLFRNVVRKAWGANEVEFYVTRNGQKAITAINQRHLDNIISEISQHVAEF